MDIFDAHHLADEARHARSHASNTPCVLCGRKVNTRRRYWAVEGVEGSALYLARPGTFDPNAPGAQAAYLGMNPVGPECSKLIPREFLTRMDAEEE